MVATGEKGANTGTIVVQRCVKETLLVPEIFLVEVGCDAMRDAPTDALG